MELPLFIYDNYSAFFKKACLSSKKDLLLQFFQSFLCFFKTNMTQKSQEQTKTRGTKPNLDSSYAILSEIKIKKQLARSLLMNK